MTSSPRAASLHPRAPRPRRTPWRRRPPRRTLRRLGAAVLLAALASGCDYGKVDPVPPVATAPRPGTDHASSPLRNPDGTKAGLAPLTSPSDRAKARSLIDRVTTKGRGPRTGYDRDEFGYAWMDTADGVPLARNGCDTRNDLLKRDGLHVRFRSGSNCVVTSMTLHDPYTGTTVEWRKQQATEVQIDHVVPLSYSWQMGASHWPEDKREQLANDPLNLLPVDGPANSSKGDSGPASWLPPSEQIRCAYAARFAQVAVKYDLPVTTADRDMMLRQCGAKQS